MMKYIKEKMWCIKCLKHSMHEWHLNDETLETEYYECVECGNVRVM